MKKEDLFNDDFFKQFKNGDELSRFLNELQKRAVEKMLEGELDAHMGYRKNEQSENPNSRNGHTTKKIKNTFGESYIKVPRDRDGSFEPSSSARPFVFRRADGTLPISTLQGLENQACVKTKQHFIKKP
ncbi:transposase [Rapidithrix thailandica]|uniref:Mutator family transposase n=1 Tax=Rapidithrix thailandica TaxID=413964 RepID=A0AAW9SGL7_9BACT